MAQDSLSRLLGPFLVSGCRHGEGSCIATESPATGSGSSFDLVLVDVPEWTEKHREWAEKVQREFRSWTEARDPR